MNYQLPIREYLSQHGFPTFCPKAVLFDMDGVLFDSMPLHAKSWAKVCTDFGLEMTPEEAYMNEGRTAKSTIDLLMQRQYGRDATDEEVTRIYAEKCKLFNGEAEAPKMAGAQQVLENVREHGLQILVVTGSGQKSLLTRLETNYPGFFHPDRVVSSKDVQYGKPNPEPYLKGLAKAGVHPWEALVVENAPLGVESAHGAGIFTIAANTGPLEDSLLRDAGADIVVPGMMEVAALLQGRKA